MICCHDSSGDKNWNSAKLEEAQELLHEFKEVGPTLKAILLSERRSFAHRTACMYKERLQGMHERCELVCMTNQFRQYLQH